MIIDEMIKMLKHQEMFLHGRYVSGDRIVAALMAGQEMRVAIDKEWDNIGFQQTEDAVAKWDAALKDTK